jgi:hypothetical protein
MDPYLEQFWRDVHASMVIYARDQLQAQLPGDLRARVEERIVVENPDNGDRPVFPDVRVVERGCGRPEARAAEGGVALAEPIVIHLPPEPMTETFIEILDVGSGKRVVTVIEFLSLSNKLPGDGHEQYLRKQRELRQGRVSLVEIDFLRSGQHVLAVPYHSIPSHERAPYRACVRRGWKEFAFEYYALPLRERMPAIRIPLRQTDQDALLNLQSLIEQCYRNGGYDDDIDYRADPLPALEPADAAWADELLRIQGRR